MDRVELAGLKLVSELQRKSLSSQVAYGGGSGIGINGHTHSVQERHGHSGRFHRVEQCGLALLSIDTGRSAGHYFLGLSALDEHHFNEAIRHSKHALIVNPDHAGAWLVVSDSYLELGKTQQAKHAVDEALRVRPTVPALVRAAHLQSMTHQTLSAKRLYMAAIRSSLAAGDRGAAAWTLREAAAVFDLDGQHRAAAFGRKVAADIELGIN